VVDQRAVEGGVEFDIRIPGNDLSTGKIDHRSSGFGGQGALVGTHVGPYEAFALGFTLVSVDGQSGSDLPHEVSVGALIGPAGDGRLEAYETLVLTFAPDRTSQVATTPIGTRIVRNIGFHAEIANPEVWSPDGTLLTLRVEPAPNADVLAEPVREPVEEETPRDRTTTSPPAYRRGTMRAW
jgi:hypothetical protein